MPFIENQQKFDAIRKLNLPLGHYAITGSGALGIRNLRAIGDIDIVVTAELWTTLAAKYGVIEKNGVRLVQFPDGIVEAMSEGSFYLCEKDPLAPTIAERISQAEQIEGLPFETLAHVRYYKQKMGRDKDLKDISLIDSIKPS